MNPHVRAIPRKTYRENLAYFKRNIKRVCVHGTLPEIISTHNVTISGLPKTHTPKALVVRNAFIKTLRELKLEWWVVVAVKIPGTDTVVTYPYKSELLLDQLSVSAAEAFGQTQQKVLESDNFNLTPEQAYVYMMPVDAYQTFKDKEHEVVLTCPLNQ